MRELQKRNLVHLELLRVIAIFCVLFNHTDEDGFWLFCLSEGSPLYFVYLVLSIACKVAVPLFFMASGALLLGKNESIGTLYKKRVLRFAVILVIISVVYAIYYHFRLGTPMSVGEFFRELYSSNLSVALWFLYAYLGILIMLPLLRRLAQNMKTHEYVYLAALSLVFIGILPILEYRFSLNEVTINSNLRGALFVAAYVVFFLMGYFFEHVLPEKYFTTRNAVIGIVLSVICIAVCCYMTWFRAGLIGPVVGDASEMFHDSLIAIPTYTLFFCSKLLFMKREVSLRWKQFICVAGSTTFGIFLLEGILREETRPIFDALQPIIKTMPACVVWIFVACVIGGVATFFIKKIPVIGKFI